MMQQRIQLRLVVTHLESIRLARIDTVVHYCLVQFPRTEKIVTDNLIITPKEVRELDVRN